MHLLSLSHTQCLMFSIVHLEAGELVSVAIRIPLLHPLPWTELAHIETRQEALGLVLLVFL